MLTGHDYEFRCRHLVRTLWRAALHRSITVFRNDLFHHLRGEQLGATTY